MNYTDYIRNGQAVVGIEFGSTRIKAVMIDDEFKPIASGSHQWENSLVNGIWSYSTEEITEGLKDCYKNLKDDVQNKYGVGITTLKALGFSGMMHGYIALDEDDRLLVPFRTWRNTITEEAARILSKELSFNIPQRWTSAHLYQAILNKEPHVNKIKSVTTLAGYIHYLLTGEYTVGVGEASGIFPIDPYTLTYDSKMAEKYNALLSEAGFKKTLTEVFPRVLTAGENAGYLTKEGALLLDPTGNLMPGIPLCPPEGDAGTGMTATNSVLKRTGNVSAGTSVFSMVVLERPLKNYYGEIDIVTTPDGAPVAMVHCNNCTSDINAYVGLFREFADLMGIKADTNGIYSALYKKSLEASPDCDGVIACNYCSGEAITGFTEGRPLLVRNQDTRLTLANFMRTHLYSAFATLKIGNDILLGKEHVEVDNLYGHGGIFTTKGVAQQYLADALNSPVSVMETAGEGGPWGMAILASYMAGKEEGETLSEFLQNKVFKGEKGSKLYPDPEGVKGFERYIEMYKRALEVERAAVERM